MEINEFNKCVDEYSNGIYRFLLKNLRNPDAAKDLVQDCYEKLWVRHGEIDAGKAKSFLFACAYNSMVDYCRRSSRSIAQEPQESVSLSENTRYTDLNDALAHALRQLPDIQRSVVLLRDYEGYSYDEIAEITSLTLSAVKVYIFRARVFLKEFLTKSGVCPETYLVEEY